MNVLITLQSSHIDALNIGALRMYVVFGSLFNIFNLFLLRYS